MTGHDEMFEMVRLRDKEKIYDAAMLKIMKQRLQKMVPGLNVLLNASKSS